MAQQHKKKTLRELFSKTEPDLLEILDSMLEYNPHFRPSAEQLLEHKFFDEVRNSQVETKAPYKIKLCFDRNEAKYNYEDESIALDQKSATEYFMTQIRKEQVKINMLKVAFENALKPNS